EPRRQFTIGGRLLPERAALQWMNEASGSIDYAKTIGLPLVEGRMWTEGDRAAGWSVGVVNREAARRYWPSRSPIGDRVTILDANGRGDDREITIIGVVDNVPIGDLSEPPPPRVYRPIAAASSLTSVAFGVRSGGDPTLVAPAIREALRAEDRDLAASQV